MSLADLAKAPARPGRKECSVAWIASQLDEQDRADLEAAIANPSAALEAISKALSQMGYHIAAQTIGRHAHGSCLCGKACRP